MYPLGLRGPQYVDTRSALAQERAATFRSRRNGMAGARLRIMDDRGSTPETMILAWIILSDFVAP